MIRGDASPRDPAARINYFIDAPSTVRRLRKVWSVAELSAGFGGHRSGIRTSRQVAQIDTWSSKRSPGESAQNSSPMLSRSSEPRTLLYNRLF